MKLLFLSLFILLGCGKEEPEFTLEQQEIISEQKSTSENIKGSLLYMTLSGINLRTNEKEFIRLDLSKLKDFSMHSGLLVNFDKLAQDHLKKETLDWNNFQIHFKFSEDTAKRLISLNTISNKYQKRIDVHSNLVFNLTEKDKVDLWSSINPIDVTFISRSKDLIEKKFSLKSKTINLDKEKTPPYSTFWIDEITCSIKHSVKRLVTSRNGATSMRLFQQDVTYSDNSCSDFDEKLTWQNKKTASFNFQSNQKVHTDFYEYFLTRLPMKTVNRINVRKRQYIDKNHVNWFKFRLTWFE